METKRKYRKSKQLFNNKSNKSKYKPDKSKSKSTYKDKDKFRRKSTDDKRAKSYQGKPRRYRSDEDDKQKPYAKKRKYSNKFKDDNKSYAKDKSHRKFNKPKFTKSKAFARTKSCKVKKDDTTFKVQKIIANSGYTSRRTAEELILSGKVTTSKGKVSLGDRLRLDEKLYVDGKEINHFQTTTSQLLMYNKPVGEIVSNVGADTVFANLPKIAVGKWINVGRLDVESEGLILFTNNGDLANKFAHPSFGVEREYLVKSRMSITDEIMQDAIAKGINIIGEVIKPICFSKRASKSGKYFWYEITLSQGRNRVIRKLFKVLDADVTRLIRIRFGDIILPKELKTGEWIYLKTPDNL